VGGSRIKKKILTYESSVSMWSLQKKSASILRKKTEKGPLKKDSSTEGIKQEGGQKREWGMRTIGGTIWCRTHSSKGMGDILEGGEGKVRYVTQ